MSIKLWGFDASTYVRTVKTVLAEKGVTDFEQVNVNVLEGDARSDEHLTRHPFGKVPVLDHDGMRIIETSAICRYLDSVLPGPSVIPSDPKDRARMDMTTSIVDSYAYSAIIGGVVAYHLFPHFVGGRNEEMHRRGRENGKKALDYIMGLKGSDPWIAGAQPSVADYYVGPLLFYVTLTPHKEEFLAVDGVADWWAGLSQRDSFRSTEPSL